jgi:hypothetical protein
MELIAVSLIFPSSSSYVGRFYNYDNIDELNNNEDLIKNVALKFNDMERMLSDMSNLPNVITELC